MHQKMNKFAAILCWFLSLYRTGAFSTVPTKTQNGISKSIDPEYPQNFTGRLWFNPALVKVDKNLQPGSDVSIISLFGYTLGGTVTLEYDSSPVGPYREYVTMSAFVSKRGSIGQWGSRLYVSTQEAEDVCRDIWGVPAELANIDFIEDGKCLKVTSPPNPALANPDKIDICVEGWKNTRVLCKEDYEYANGSPKRYGNAPVNWTPTIKALWAPFVPSNDKGDVSLSLPLHKLRLSASAIRLHWSGLEKSSKWEELECGIPLGLGLIVDNVLIEIGVRCDEDL